MRSIYITGCNGFIGSRMMQYFEKIPGFDVYGIRKGGNERLSNIVYSDYRKVDFLKRIIKENCYVIHTACYIPEPENDNQQTEVINTEIIDFILEAFENKKVEGFFNFSSISVYGYGKKELKNVTEDTEIVLPSYYAKSKYKSEILLSKFFQKNYNMRISSPFGIGKKRKNVIDLIIEKILNNEEIIIYGEGKRKQDYIWVEDIARVIKEMLDKSIMPGDYNLCTGTSLSIEEIISLVENFTKKRAKVKSINERETYSVTISNEKLLKGIGINKSFFTTFEKIIKEFYDNTL